MIGRPQYLASLRSLTPLSYLVYCLRSQQLPAAAGLTPTSGTLRRALCSQGRSPSAHPAHSFVVDPAHAHACTM